MNKIKAFIYTLTVATMMYLYCRAITLQKQNISLETQIAKNKAYYEFQISKLKKEKENALEIIHSNEVLERAIKEDNINFDWQFNIANSSSIVNLKRLHDNRI